MEELVSRSTPEELEAYSRIELSECQKILDEITGLDEEGSETARNPENTLRPFDRLVTRLGVARRGIGLYRSVHPSAQMRRTAERCEQELSDFFTELRLDRELYEAVKACDRSVLDDVGQRMHRHLLRDFYRSGVDRDEATRGEVQKLRKQLVELGQEFARNILSDVRSIRLDDVSELEGLPGDYIANHLPDQDGKITITTDYPDYYPFMSYARSDVRREELYRAFRSRAYPQNIPVLEKILRLRYELANLLGYSSWADYASEDKMIQKAEAISAFIERISEAASRPSIEEYDRLLSRRRQDDPESAEVADWERAYYEEIIRQEMFSVDSRELRPYFSYPAVKEGLFTLTSSLFGVEFRPASEVQTWDEDVEVTDVYENGRMVGRVYLDMHPREGKFKHAAMFPLVQGVRGGRPPEAALVCNFPKPGTGGGAALLEHDDVVTFFHEFGHLLHHLFGRDQEWVEFSGTGTEWDFVEVPSQLFEEWAWDTTVLQSFARHHETGEVIPEELVERLRKARAFGRGLQVRQQMYYASLSLKCHDGDPSEIDLNQLQRELHDQYSRFRFVEGTYFHASFGHLDSYSALYYTYMWSLVIEKDIFSHFKERGIMNRETASSYRECILAPGGAKDAADLVRDFLGRPYDYNAFEKWLSGE